MAAESPSLTIARLARLLESHVTADLTFPQYRVLGLLAGGDERSTALAARLAVAKPTVTSLVDSLVERGYVVRDTAPGDRRVVRLAITVGGRDALRATEVHLAEVLADVVRRCADPDAVLAALEQVRGALDDRWAEVVAGQAAGR